VAVVFDTNVLISAVLLAQSRPSLAVRWAATSDQMPASSVTFSELVSTMEKAKFDRYASQASRREFVAFVYANVRFVTIERTIHACRDPDDDKFLEVAVNGGANALVTGDADLLALDPFEGISIMTATDYLARFAG
jgi:putative PIN family toxin of toxin-antitoxin system